MDFKNNKGALIGIAALLLLAVGVAWWYSGNDERVIDRSDEFEAVVRGVVTDFGSRMQNVSTGAPRAEAAQSIRENYADLIAPELLLAWQQAPSTAAGRAVSSPWPDRIEIDEVTTIDADTYVVNGRVILVTSTGEAGEEPVRITVERRGTVWLIAEYDERSGVGAIGTYRGELPAASSPGRTLELDLLPDDSAVLTTDYQNGEAPIIETGTWEATGENEITLTLTGAGEEAYEEPVIIVFAAEGDTLRATEYDEDLYGSAGITVQKIEG
jgi:hypothetical protein